MLTYATYFKIKWASDDPDDFQSKMATEGLSKAGMQFWMQSISHSPLMPSGIVWEKCWKGHIVSRMWIRKFSVFCPDPLYLCSINHMQRSTSTQNAVYYIHHIGKWILCAGHVEITTDIINVKEIRTAQTSRTKSYPSTLNQHLTPPPVTKIKFQGYICKIDP